MKLLAVTFLLLLVFQKQTNCARILAFAAVPSYSHQIVFRPIWKELAARGHDLVVLTTDPMRNSSLKNIKEIDLHGAYYYWNVKVMTEKLKYNIYKDVHQLTTMMNDVLKFELEHVEVQKLLNDKNEHFDLIVVEYLFPSLSALSYRFNCPFVGITSMDAPVFVHYVMGNPTSPAVYTDSQLSLVPPLTFFERVISFLFRVLYNFIRYLIIIPNDNVIIKKYFGHDAPDVLDLAQNLSMVFINTNPIFQPIRPWGPATIAFAGGSHLQPLKELPPVCTIWELSSVAWSHISGYAELASSGSGLVYSIDKPIFLIKVKSYIKTVSEIKAFLESSEIIYFSFGTNIKSHLITSDLLHIIVKSLENLPYKVLWKFDRDVPNLPKNVKIMKWVPQQDILRHPNVKLFLTQGGLQSIEEAIYCSIPMVVIPFFDDQKANAKLIANKGFGLAIDRRSINVDNFTATILEVINNPKYKNNIKEAANIMIDQPMPGPEKVAWWMENVIRHKGAQHLKSYAFNLPWYKYYLIDVIAFILFLLYIFYLILKLSGKMWRSICKGFGCKTYRSKKKQA